MTTRKITADVNAGLRSFRCTDGSELTLPTFNALTDAKTVQSWVTMLLEETRPANIVQLGLAFRAQGSETGDTLVAVARARYLQLTATDAPAARINPVTPAEAPVATGSGWDGEIADGTYTVQFADGTYRTLKIHTQDASKTFKPGARLISYLNGPDNWANYQGFGEILPGNQLQVWRKHESATTIISAALALLAGPEAMVNGLKAYGRASGKCGMCGRKLTTPESLDRGIGPECAGKIGL